MLCSRLFVQATVMMSLLQPPPEVFELFDDVLLLSEGQVVYHGPREQVMPFFHSLGFAIPARKGVADFLQEVTSRKVRSLRLSAKHRAHQNTDINCMVC